MNFNAMLEEYQNSKDKQNIRYIFEKKYSVEMNILNDKSNWFNKEKLPVKLYIMINQLVDYPVCQCSRPIYRFNMVAFKFNEICNNKDCHFRKEHNSLIKKQTCLSKYGVENQFQRKEIIDDLKNKFNSKSVDEKKAISVKRQETNIKKYGVSVPAKNQDILNKIKLSCMEKYGVDTVLKDRKKINESVIAKFGVDNVMKVETIKNKMAKATIDKFGGLGFGATEIRHKIIKTNVLKYGSENPMNNTSIKNKIKTTNIEKYGVPTVLLLPHNRQKSSDSWLFKMSNKINGFPTLIPLFNSDEYVGISTLYNWSCTACETIFESNLEDGKYPKCPKCFPYKKSKQEYNIKYFLETLGLNVEHNKKPFGNFEIDLLIRDKKLAIEYNGLYWHSESMLRNKNYHLEKTNSVEANGFQLLQIYEHQWLNKSEIIESMIKAKVGMCDTKIYGRKCNITIISDQLKNDFLNQNHIQGQDDSQVSLGLWHNNILVSVMTFGEPLFNKSYEWELIRFANKLNHCVVGGMSKLFNFFIKNYNPTNIISYADRSYSLGQSYVTIGFELLQITPPNFWVFGKHIKGADHSVNWQKSQLKNKLEKYDSDLSLWDNLKNNGYNRYWDSGNYLFIWNSKTND